MAVHIMPVFSWCFTSWTAYLRSDARSNRVFSAERQTEAALRQAEGVRAHRHKQRQKQEEDKPCSTDVWKDQTYHQHSYW